MEPEDVQPEEDTPFNELESDTLEYYIISGQHYFEKGLFDAANEPPRPEGRGI